MNLAELLKDSAYRLTQFKPSQIAALEAGITQKDTGKALSLYVIRKRLVESAYTQNPTFGAEGYCSAC